MSYNSNIGDNAVLLNSLKKTEGNDNCLKTIGRVWVVVGCFVILKNTFNTCVVSVLILVPQETLRYISFPLVFLSSVAVLFIHLSRNKNQNL